MRKSKKSTRLKILAALVFATVVSTACSSPPMKPEDAKTAAIDLYKKVRLSGRACELRYDKSLELVQQVGKVSGADIAAYSEALKAIEACDEAALQMRILDFPSGFEESVVTEIKEGQNVCSAAYTSRAAVMRNLTAVMDGDQTLKTTVEAKSNIEDVFPQSALCISEFMGVGVKVGVPFEDMAKILP